MKKRRLKKGPKIILLLLVIALIFSLFLEFDSVQVESKAAVVMEVDSGNVLYEKNARTAYSVASISKIMTMYIVLEKLETSEIDWDDHIVISETANNLMDSAVRLPVENGDVLTVEELFTAIVVASSNNAAIALAEHIAGSEDLFTEMMNEQAATLGLSNQTLFVNASGLPTANNAENEMTATDVAKLAKILLEKYEQIVLPITSLPTYYVESQAIEIATTNQMLGENGVDGLKTGYTNKAGYSFAGTAKQGDKRLITVILDAPGNEERFLESNQLLDFGFEKKSLPSVRGVINKLKGIVKESM